MIKYYPFLLALLIVSCTVEERPIDYGTDDCEYCKMTIMDHRYGSELVTEKGKIFTFDAAECLLDYINYNEGIKEESKLLLVTPFTNPEKLIDARTATYLISRQMPSPMGAYLTAFSELETAKVYQESKGGDLYTWEELIKDFSAIRSDINKNEE